VLTGDPELQPWRHILRHNKQEQKRYGTKEKHGMTETTPTRLKRAPHEGIVAGVCAGLGDYFNIDPVFVRIALIIFVLLGGSGILAYLLAWYIMPDDAGQHSLAPLLVFLGLVLLPLLLAPVVLLLLLFV
jgi:phage shock protein PspC (stress-responsive transcriptional regulator)